MLYLDLDNVMADFYKAAKEVSGLPEYSDNMWEYIEKVDHFFYKLEVLPYAWQLLAYLEYENIHYEFLTSTCLPTGTLWQCQADKVRWVQRKLNSAVQVNCVTNWRHKKWFCTGKDDILIDDLDRNCKDWESVGGIAILHKNFDDTIKQLKEIYK